LVPMVNNLDLTKTGVKNSENNIGGVPGST
jgi:hypothetical protein